MSVDTNRLLVTRLREQKTGMFDLAADAIVRLETMLGELTDAVGQANLTEANSHVMVPYTKALGMLKGRKNETNGQA